MLKLMLIQRGGATAHKILDNTMRFHDFYELIAFEHFGEDVITNESQRSIYVPHNDTTYTMLEMPEIVSAVTQGLN